MAFPVVEAVNESAQTATGTSVVVNLPASIAAGDLLVVIVAKGGDATPGAFNTLSGWSELVDEASLRGAFVAYRWADGTEGATVTFTATGTATRFAHISFRISGAENPATQAPQISAVATGTSQAPNPDTVTPTGGAKDYLWLTFFTLAGEEADDDTWTNNAATNYGNLLQKTSGTGGTNVGANLAVCRRTNNAASEDAVWPAASVDQSLAWRAFTIAVHPASIDRTGTVTETQDAQTSTASGTVTAPANPVFGSAGTQLQGSASTMNVDVPDDVASGDIIVVTAMLSPTVTVTGFPSGFAHAPGSPRSAENHGIVVMWKRATGADSTAGTYDFTLSASTYRNAQAIRYTGAATTGDPWDVTDANDSGSTGVSTTPAVSVTTTVDDTLLVWAATNWAGGAWTPPSGFTERRDTGDAVCTVADLAQAAAGSSGSITGTCATTDKSTAWLGALSATAGTDVTGTAAVTQTDQTSTATGVLGYSGTSTVTQAAQTSTASGILGYSGTLAETQGDQTSAATGVLGYSGTVTETQDAQTSTASGTVAGASETTGSLAETQADQTSTATGVLGYTGTVTRTQTNQTATASGWITVTGTAAETQDSNTATASGVLGYTGTVARTQGNQTSVAAGWIQVTGLAATIQAAQEPAATGFVGEIPVIPEILTLTAISGDESLSAIKAPLTLQAMED